MSISQSTLQYLKEYFAHAPVLELGAGAPIFLQGDPARVMYLILKGSVEILVEDRSVALLGAGETFGEVALIEGGEYGATALAASDVRLAEINEARFEELVRSHPPFAKHLLHLLAERLQGMVGR